MIAAARVWGIVFRIHLERFIVDHIAKQGTDRMNAHEIIRDEVLSWPGVTEEPHRFGGMEFRLAYQRAVGSRQQAASLNHRDTGRI
jgi:luciferase-like monooxygenase